MIKWILLAPFVVACGCGGDGAATGSDAGQGDAGPGGPTVTVTVDLYDPDGTPIEGASVMYGNGNGQFVGTVQSDSGGHASVEVPSGGYVTAAVGDYSAALGGTAVSADVALFTVFGVEDGDSLRVGSPATTLGTFEYTYVDSGERANWYTLRSPCATSTAMLASLPQNESVTLTDRCLNPDGTLDVLAIAGDQDAIDSASGGDIAAFATAVGVPVNGTPPEQSVSVTLDNWQEALTSANVEFTNEQAEAVDATVAVIGFRNRHAYYHNRQQALLQPDGTLSLPIKISLFFDAIVAEGGHLASVGDADYAAIRYGGMLLPDEAGGTAIGLSSFLVPPLMTDATFDFATVTITTGLGATAMCAATDAVALEGYFAGESSSSTYLWHVRAPYGESFTFPDIDPALTADLWPADLVETRAGMTVYNDTGATYEDYRARDMAGFYPGLSALESTAVSVCTSSASY